MADDSVTYEVITDYVSRGLATSVDEVKSMREALAALQKQGDVTKNSALKLARALKELEKGVKVGEIKAVTQAFQDQVQALDANARAFQKMAQVQREGGNLSPTKGAISGIPLQQLREDVATYEALNANYISEAQKTLATEKKIVEARKSLYSAQGDDYFAKQKRGMSEVEAAAVDLTRAQNLLATANKKVTDAQKSGDREKYADALEEQATATRNLTAAEERHHQAQKKGSQSAAHLSAQLPRIRYALYDVSRTAAIAGAAMLGLAGAVFVVATRMDRQFADVIRTSQTTGKAARDLRKEFTELFQSIPVSWQALTEIGTLGGQLGIAAEDLADFTSLVAKFSATTNVSVEEAATAFGRLSELLHVPSEQFEALGSSILKVGVNSVATEKDIITVSSQIASIANNSGFAADEVIGLSAALSSLGTKPELSRGTITRLFTNINVAIATGSRRLEEFGELAGMTGKEFASAWGDDAAGALQKLLGRLGQLGETDATQTLKDIGIVAARDIPTILKLAQNTDVLTAAMADASSGFTDATTLNDHYGVIAETVSAKLEVLRNNFSAFVATIGESANSIGPVIDALSKMLQTLTNLVDNPAATWAFGITMALTVLGGVILLVTGGLLRMAGSWAAARSALVDAAVGTGLYANNAAAAAVSSRVLTKELMGVAAAARTTAGAATAATVAIRALKIASGIGIALLALDAAFLAAAGSGGKLSEVDLSDLSDALTKDTETYAESGQNITVLTVALDDAKEGFDGVKDAANESTVAVGEFTEAWLRNQFATSDLGALIKDSGATTEQTDQLIKALLGDPENAVAITEQWFNRVYSSQRAAIDSFYAYADEQAALGLIYPELPTEVAEAERLFSQLKDFAETTGDAIVEQADKVATADFWRTTAEGGEDATDSFEGLIEMVHNAVGMFTDVVDATLKVQDSLFNLGASLRDNGLDWSEFSAGGRQNIGALMSVIDALVAETPGDIKATVESLMGLFQFLIDGGYATAQQLMFLQGVIANLKMEAANQGVTEFNAAVFDGTSFLQGFTPQVDKAGKSLGKAGKKAKQAAKEIRTVLDYASDLKSVFDDAFDFRFGVQIAKDDYRKTIMDITQGFEDAAKRVRELKLEIQGIKATIQGLKASQNTLEYFLSIAIEYGDTLRETEIRALLAENAADQAKAQEDLSDTTKDLKKEEEKATPKLTGYTEAAIDQREAILSLIQAAEDELVAMAAAGASKAQLKKRADELKKGIEAQMKAWGYSTGEIKKYTAALDDVPKIIEKVPRKLTVEATMNMDPAQKALDIFLEKNKDKKVTTTNQVNTSYGKVPKPPKVPAPDPVKVQIKFQMPSYKQMMKMQDYIRTVTGNPKFRIALPGGQGGQTFAEGGYTGSGGKYQPAGIVHKGEYVVPKHLVNQRTGLPYMDAMGRLPQSAPGGSTYAAGGFVSGNPLVGPLSLTAGTIQQLANAVQPYLVVDNKVLGNATDKAYTQGTRVGAH